MRLFEDHLEFGSNSILLATDLSPSSDTATAYAVRIARRYNAKIIALEVFDYAWAGSPKTGGIPIGLAVMESAAEEAMEKLRIDLCKENIRCESLLIDGDPASKILNAIIQKNVDLVVLGTHGKEGWNRFAWGSVAEEVLRKASCAVLTVGPKVPRPTQYELTLRNLVFATDFSPASSRAAPYAFTLASDFGACLHLIHILPSSMGGHPDETELTRASRQALIALVQKQAPCCHNLSTEINYGEHLDEAILARADMDSADLIVLGVRKASQLAAHIPDITSQVIGEAKCPVLTICS
jgi:nucleotide-binding universal stress UspA family protein